MIKYKDTVITKVIYNGTNIETLKYNNKIVFHPMPVPTLSGSYTYTGSTITPTFTNYDSSMITIGGTYSAINGGTYIATFTPKDGYQWEDGGVDTRSVSWSIAYVWKKFSCTANASTYSQSDSSSYFTGSTANNGYGHENDFTDMGLLSSFTYFNNAVSRATFYSDFCTNSQNNTATYYTFNTSTGEYSMINNRTGYTDTSNYESWPVTVTNKNDSTTYNWQNQTVEWWQTNSDPISNYQMPIMPGSSGTNSVMYAFHTLGGYDYDSGEWGYGLEFGFFKHPTYRPNDGNPSYPILRPFVIKYNYSDDDEGYYHEARADQVLVRKFTSYANGYTYTKNTTELGTVTSYTLSDYPTDGEQDGYWYTLQTT